MMTDSEWKDAIWRGLQKQTKVRIYGECFVGEEDINTPIGKELEATLKTRGWFVSIESERTHPYCSGFEYNLYLYTPEDIRVLVTGSLSVGRVMRCALERLKAGKTGEIVQKAPEK